MGIPEIGPGAALAYTPVPIRTSLPSAISCFNALLICAALPKRTRSRRSTTSPRRAAIERWMRSFTLADRTSARMVLGVAKEAATAGFWFAMHAHRKSLQPSGRAQSAG